MSSVKRIDIGQSLRLINEKIESAYLKRTKEIVTKKPILVAVSKTKPDDAIIEAYENGQRHFGENYVQELVAKSTSSALLHCSDIKWHFIGHLQTNKINKVLAVPNLYMVETVDSKKLADSLNSAVEKSSALKPPLNILIQINTSKDSAKSGVAPENALDLYSHVTKNCKYLKLNGVMTIGAYGYDCSAGPNPDFLELVKCFDLICKELELKPTELEISMGMSSDYEHAIELGSTLVRVGSLLFGDRDTSKIEEK